MLEYILLLMKYVVSLSRWGVGIENIYSGILRKSLHTESNGGKEELV
jgi:hypothetical protein